MDETPKKKVRIVHFTTLEQADEAVLGKELVSARPVQLGNFNNMPKEVQNMIWKEIAFQTRTVTIEVEKLPGQQGLVGQRWFRFHSASKVPAIPQVNQAARIEGLRYYKLEFGFNLDVQGGATLIVESRIYVNFEVDTICFLRCEEACRVNHRAMRSFTEILARQACPVKVALDHGARFRINTPFRIFLAVMESDKLHECFVFAAKSGVLGSAMSQASFSKHKPNSTNYRQSMEAARRHADRRDNDDDTEMEHAQVTAADPIKQEELEDKIYPAIFRFTREYFD